MAGVLPSDLIWTLEIDSLLGKYSLLLGKIKSGQSCPGFQEKKSQSEKCESFCPWELEIPPSWTRWRWLLRTPRDGAPGAGGGSLVTDGRRHGHATPAARTDWAPTPGWVPFWHLLHIVEPSQLSGEVEMLLIPTFTRTSSASWSLSPTPAGHPNNAAFLYVTAVSSRPDSSRLFEGQVFDIFIFIFFSTDRVIGYAG